MTEPDESSQQFDPGDESDAGEPQAGAAISPGEAAALIRAARPSDLLSLLKRSEYAPARERIFAGFRVGPDTLKSPLARGRLITELIADTKLADGVRELPSAAGPGAEHPAKSSEPARQALSERPELQERVERLQTERDGLKQQLRAAQERLREAEFAQKALGKKADSLRSALTRAETDLMAERRQAGAREKLRRRREKETADLRAAVLARRGQVIEDAISAKATIEPATRGDSIEEQFGDILERLLAHKKTEAVWLIVEEMLRRNPSDPIARRMRALLRIGQGDRAGALDDLRFAFDAAISAGRPADAARLLAQTVSASGAADQKMANSLFAALGKRAEDIAEAAQVLHRIGPSSESYQALREWCRPPLQSKLFPVEDGSGAGSEARDVYPLRDVGLGELTARDIIAAIDRGDAKTTGSARNALRQAAPEARQKLRDALQDVLSGGDRDDSYFRLLTIRDLAGPAIVDASNAAHYELELLASERPLLSSILAVRRALREQVFFPVHLIADANLTHKIDRSAEIKQMIQRGEVEVVTPGTDADEVIVRDAKRLGAIVVTNDYMADWDKDGEVEKVQYAISLTNGRATLYF